MLTRNFRRFNILFDAHNIDEGGLLMMTVDRNTLIGDVLDADETTGRYFAEMGMHCLGCPASRGETVAQACEVHGTDADALIKKLNEHLSSSDNAGSR